LNIVNFLGKGNPMLQLFCVVVIIFLVVIFWEDCKLRRELEKLQKRIKEIDKQIKREALEVFFREPGEEWKNGDEENIEYENEWINHYGEEEEPD